jgi:hypothetical protein
MLYRRSNSVCEIIRPDRKKRGGKHPACPLLVPQRKLEAYSTAFFKTPSNTNEISVYKGSFHVESHSIFDRVEYHSSS